MGHDRLPTWGVGKDHDKRFWRSILRQLVAAGLLSTDRHGGLRLAGDAMAVLRGEQELTLRKDALDRKPARKRKSSSAGSSAAPSLELETDTDRELFEVLRAKRMELAREQGVPPYVIFSDRSLIEMAVKRPQDDEEFLAINGVGAVKLERYGEVFLGLVAG